MAGLVAVTAAAVGVHLATRGPEIGIGAEAQAPPEPGVLLVLPADADPLTERLAEATAGYLSTVSGQPVAPTRLGAEAAGLDALEGLAQEHRAGLVVVLEADRLAPEAIDAARIEALGPDGFVLDTVDVGAFDNRLGDRGATVVLTAGGGRLPRQYAAYELLRRLGVRFFHPEQEHVPQPPRADLRALARRPTLLHRGGPDYRPDFAWRSWSFHSAHPLEHLEAFSDPAHPIDEAVHVDDWVVKGFGNRFRGAGRGVVSEQAQAVRAQQLDELRELLGFPRGTGI
ncbi:MAG: hypothetical protein KDK70_23945 [Myxococcales bacterium]|nr:hypothetical protein [Myxococcales bacterium]